MADIWFQSSNVRGFVIFIYGTPDKWSMCNEHPRIKRIEGSRREIDSI